MSTILATETAEYANIAGPRYYVEYLPELVGCPCESGGETFTIYGPFCVIDSLYGNEERHVIHSGWMSRETAREVCHEAEARHQKRMW